MFKKANVVVILLMLFSMTAVSAGVREIVLSSAVPGLGQLYGGGKTDKIIGLGFMGAEILAIHFCVDNLSLYNSLSQDTQNLKKQINTQTNNSYDQNVKSQAQWQNSYDQAKKKDQLKMPLLGAVIGVWVLNVAEVVLFPPAGKEAPAAPAPEQQKSSLQNSMDYQLVYINAQPQLLLTYRF
jgi:hypothetical protein